MDRIVRFGPDGQLVGVLTGAALPDAAPVLVLPSAGLLPRFGPFRLHVELAHGLEPLGIRTFRFEVPGVGETPRIPGCGPREATLAALDQLARQYGCREFVVGGVCTAADLGWTSALADERVRGVLMLDGLAYTGPWYQFARALGLLRRPPSEWLRAVWRRIRPPPADGPTWDIAEYREWPGREEARRQFATLLARDVRSLWIYTGGYTELFLHPRQFAWSFGDAADDARVSLLHWPDCDHTFFARVHRDRLIRTLQQWLLATAHAQQKAGRVSSPGPGVLSGGSKAPAVVSGACGR